MSSGSRQRVSRADARPGESVPREFAGSVVLITGAGTGIGRAAAVAFARAGAWIAIADVSDAYGLETLDLVQRVGDGEYHSVDVCHTGELRDTIRNIVNNMGRLDVMVNNAGIPMSLPIDKVNEDDWTTVVDVNLKGMFFGCKYAIEAMLSTGGGAIVNNASDMGLGAGLPNQPAYVASKGGAVLLTKALALDFATRGIRVNCVCPCITDTPMLEKFVATQFPTDVERYKARRQLGEVQPIGRMCSPEEVAEAILFLASPRASGITGVALPVDGGFAAR